MPVNPALRQETLNNPIQRGNPLNDPQYQNQQGYNSYDLNASELCTPRFGEVTPNSVFETVPGDRHMLYGNSETFLNQIDSRLVSTVNMYMDYFYVPMRCMYPINYEKIIPNPTKGDDIPDTALPSIPLLQLLREMLGNTEEVYMNLGDPEYQDGISGNVFQLNGAVDFESASVGDRDVALNNLVYVAYALSRGQLLDYLGFALELDYTNAPYEKYKNNLQLAIEQIFSFLLNQRDKKLGLVAYDPSASGDGLADAYYDFAPSLNSTIRISYLPDPEFGSFDLASFRGALYDALEHGYFVRFFVVDPDDLSHVPLSQNSALFTPVDDTDDGSLLLDGASSLWRFLYRFSGQKLENGLPRHCINPSRLLAYQMSVAEYMSNDSIDNIFTGELWLQNMRAIMFPSVSNITQERTFKYNGVDTEYDLFTYGAFEQAFFQENGIISKKLLPFISNLLFMRRSLRYGDYFATGRPNLLAVGQLGIPVSSDNTINPLDVTKNLVLQRFLNAVNWVGSRFVNYMTAIFGVKPSSVTPHPIFLAHRKVTLGRDTVTNTATDQGRQTTNLIGNTDSQAVDVFIDDYGVIIGMTSFDVLPIYPAGVAANFWDSDRYSLFNPMLQNVGDQAILASELSGVLRNLTNVSDADLTFAYTVRYAQYKFGVSRAHGAFVNDLPGYAMLYPQTHFGNFQRDGEVVINPDFIRDKPFYFDQFFESRTGLSPARYYHFIHPVTNVHSAARKMQYQPPVL